MFSGGGLSLDKPGDDKDSEATRVVLGKWVASNPDPGAHEM